MKFFNILKRQMRYWNELAKNTTLRNALNKALIDIHNDGIKEQSKQKKQILKRNLQDDLRIRHIHYLMNRLEPPIEIFYPNGSVKLIFQTGQELKIKGKSKKD